MNDGPAHRVDPDATQQIPADAIRRADADATQRVPADAIRRADPDATQRVSAETIRNADSRVPHQPEAPRQPEHQPTPADGDAAKKFLDDSNADFYPEDYGFPPSNRVRQSDPHTLQKYEAECDDFARRATPDEANAMDLMTANEYAAINRAMHKGHSVDDLPDLMRKDPNSGLTERSIQVARDVESLIRKAPLAATPRTVYRGVRAPRGMTKAELFQWAKDEFGLGKPKEFGGIQHTTVDPKVATRFTESNNRVGVVFEVHTRKGAPVGKMSSRELSEGEYLLPAKERLVPIGISEKVKFESSWRDQNGKPRTTEEVVVHMVDIDDLDYYFPDGLPEHLRGPHVDAPPAPHQPGTPADGGTPHQGNQGGAHQAGAQQGGAPHQGSQDAGDWRPGDSKFGASDQPGFDPAFHHKALGDQFTPGVHDPSGKFQPKEREIADRLEQEGFRVDARTEDHTKQHLKNPESMVRTHPADEGRITEFKTLNSGSANAAKRNINDASDQVPPDGEVVIDGSKVGLTEEDAYKAYRKALGQPGKTVAATVRVILGDGRLVTYVKENS